jgi:hypothetical protein
MPCSPPVLGFKLTYARSANFTIDAATKFGGLDHRRARERGGVADGGAGAAAGDAGDRVPWLGVRSGLHGTARVPSGYSPLE